MAQYTDQIGAGDLNNLIPLEYAAEIIKQVPQSSALLARARRVPMSSSKRTQPILSVLPDAYWLSAPNGLKQTTKEAWQDLVITAEELAALVVIPDALFNDAAVPLWPEVQPYLVEAIGKKVDEAGIFGADKPASWPTAVIPAAIAAGNTVVEGTGADLGVDVASLGEKLAGEGFSINGFACQPGLQWRFAGIRDATGQPIYLPGNPTQGIPGTLYGFPHQEVLNGAWDPTAATLLAADWSKFIIGIRQDISWFLSDQGVIADADGKVIVSAVQNDSKILRVVFRVGFQVANPATRLQATAASRYPAGVVVPAGA